MPGARTPGGIVLPVAGALAARAGIAAGGWCIVTMMHFTGTLPVHW